MNFSKFSSLYETSSFMKCIVAALNQKFLSVHELYRSLINGIVISVLLDMDVFAYYNYCCSNQRCTKKFPLTISLSSSVFDYTKKESFKKLSLGNQ